MSWTSETNIKGPQGPAGPAGSGTGDVTGPASAVADRIAVYNGTTGKLIKDGGQLVSDFALTSHTHTASQVTDFAEAVDDRAAVLIQNGTGITWAYNDAAGTLTPTVTVTAVPPATVAPIMDGTAAVGVATKYAREDHVHPSDVAAQAVRFDVAQTLTSVQKSRARVNIAAPLRGWIAGLTLSTAGSSATFGVAIGEAADSTVSDLMQLASAYTKTTSAWTVGTGNGALDTGAIANTTWYHVYLIKRPDTGVVDLLISLSVTAPTLPANYTLFRRIGAMKTNASAQWTLFSQRGDEFIWSVPVNDISITLGTAATLCALLSVPLGVQVTALYHSQVNLAGGFGAALINSPDEAVAVWNVPAANVSFNAHASGTSAFFTGFTRTNTSQQVRAVASAASTTFLITVYGWVDRRGRDD